MQYKREKHNASQGRSDRGGVQYPINIAHEQFQIDFQ
jgi:hypothetical protein